MEESGREEGKEVGEAPRTIPSQINIRCDDAAAVSAHDLHCNTCSSLETSSDVVSVPGKTKWYLWINACEK